jgi:hypothetical protein
MDEFLSERSWLFERKGQQRKMILFMTIPIFAPIRSFLSRLGSLETEIVVQESTRPSQKEGSDDNHEDKKIIDTAERETGSE